MNIISKGGGAHVCRPWEPLTNEISPSRSCGLKGFHRGAPVEVGAVLVSAPFVAQGGCVLGPGQGKVSMVSLLLFALFEPLDVVAELEGGAELQAHVLHDHVTA